MQYSLIIKHKLGILNRADALSRHPDYQSKDNFTEEIGLPSHIFVNTTSTLDYDHTILNAQHLNMDELQTLWSKYLLTNDNNHWTLNHHLIVMGNNNLKRGVITLYHNFPTAGHAGGRKTLLTINRDYWWLSMWQDVADFMKGCTTCQSTKSRTTQPKPPLYPITTEPDALPFETIAMNFITKLPESEGNDTILTITDQACSKASLFLPCKEQIDVKEVAALYTQKVFPHFGIPWKVISDRDTHFIARFTKELCRILQIQQNISSTYHLQTDGQLERTNQWVEQFLWIYTNGMQTDWSNWLPIVQYTHNAWPSDTTKKTPFELIMGFTPQAH